MEILWPIIKNFFPPKMLLEIYFLAPFFILTWIIFLLEKHIIKNTDIVINMCANSKHYKFNRFNKIVYKKEGRESPFVSTAFVLLMTKSNMVLLQQ